MLVENLLVAILGLAFGSFANTCALRWTEEKSIFKPLWSVCPCCGKEISLAEKIPVLSYFLYKGKCRQCNHTIPIENLITEIGMAGVFLAGVGMYGLTFDAARIIFMFWVLIVALKTDVKDMIIPDELHLACIGFGALNIIMGKATWDTVLISTFGPSLFFLLFVIFCEWMMKKDIELLGGGDIKFVASFGAVGGIPFALAMLFVGNILMVLFFSAKMIEDLKTGTQTPFPFAVGFFLAFTLMFLCGFAPIFMY